MKTVIGWFQTKLGRLPGVVRLAVKVRNQAEIIVEKGLSPHLWDSVRNGEYALLDRLGALIERFVDVGANEGDWTDHLLSAVSSDAEGLLLEPNPRVVERLRQRFAGQERVQILQIAASDGAGRQPLFLCDVSAGCSLVSGVLPDAPSVEVEVAAVDDIVRKRGWTRLDFVKIDAEGHDLNVLKGARELLGDRAIGFVQFEYMRAWAMNGSALGGAIGLLARAGYETRLLTPSGPIAFDYDFYREFFRYANFVAATREKWVELFELTA